MKVPQNADDSLLVDISDALSERDRVRFTVHTRTKLDHFAKPVMSVVRQHEEFIWLHDCLEDNDQYAGYIIPPAPPRPDFDASREKLQRLGDGEANMTKEEFAKMKQELEAEYLAIFKKTVAMHEVFLQRLAAHEKFRDDSNFKIFLEYENELAVRCKSKKEKIADSLQNLGKSLSDFIITTSQVAATTSASTSILAGHSPSRYNLNSSANVERSNGNISNSDNNASSIGPNTLTSTSAAGSGDGNNNQQGNKSDQDDIDEQYFEKERLFLALYHNSIRETAIQADKVTHLQKSVADNYLCIAQQLVKLASIEVVPITRLTKDSSSFVSCPLPSLTLPSSLQIPSSSTSPAASLPTRNSGQSSGVDGLSKEDEDRSQQLDDLDDNSIQSSNLASLESNSNNKHRDKPLANISNNQSTGGCANAHTSESLKQLLLHFSDYLEQARKIETRIASDEDLKLTDTFLYYKRDTVAAQDLLMRRLRFMAEYDTACKNLEKSKQKARTQMQYADVIQKQAKENFISISKLAKKELTEYKQRRVASFKKAFADLVELELKHLRSHSQLIINCLNTCRGTVEPTSSESLDINMNNNNTTSTSTITTTTSASSSRGLANRDPQNA